MMKKTLVTIAVVLLAGYAWAGPAPVDLTVDPGWLDTFQNYGGWPDHPSGGSELLNQDNNHWWHWIDGQNGNSVYRDDNYAPFDAVDQNYCATHGTATQYNWFLLTNPVASGEVELVWDDALRAYDRGDGDINSLYIRIYPLQGTSGYSDTPVEYWDGGLVATLNNVGYMYQHSSSYNFSTDTAPGGLIHVDQILHHSLKMDMTAGTYQWVAKDDGGVALVDTGVQNLPVALSQVAGFAFKTKSQGKEEFPAQYGFNNVGITPEPATMAVLLLGGLLGIARKRS